MREEAKPKHSISLKRILGVFLGLILLILGIAWVPNMLVVLFVVPSVLVLFVIAKEINKKKLRFSFKKLLAVYLALVLLIAAWQIHYSWGVFVLCIFLPVFLGIKAKLGFLDTLFLVIVFLIIGYGFAGN